MANPNGTLTTVLLVGMFVNYTIAYNANNRIHTLTEELHNTSKRLEELSEENSYIRRVLRATAVEFDTLKVECRKSQL